MHDARRCKFHSSARTVPQGREFYLRAMEALRASRVDFLVGGGYALTHYTGIAREVRDFDVFVRPTDIDRALAALAGSGYATELLFPHWLGKAYDGDHYIDVIFNSGNAIAEVDDAWFEYAPAGDVLGVLVRFAPVEETIWSKAFVMERERYDGADVAHLLRARGPTLDWERLLARFGDHWRVLLHHLVLFGYVYPTERACVPPSVMAHLVARLETELSSAEAGPPLCRGTLLSRAQYLVDIEHWGYEDARLVPHGSMSAEATARWTAAIEHK